MCIRLTSSISICDKRPFFLDWAKDKAYLKELLEKPN